MDLASKDFNYPQIKQVVATDNGTFINTVKDKRYDPTTNVWEAIRSLPERQAVLDFLSGAGWTIPTFLDVMSTASTSKVPAAPLRFGPWWDLAYLRILGKMIDDAPATYEDKLVSLIFAYQCLQWILMKRAMGRDDIRIQNVVLQSLQCTRGVIRHRNNLSRSDLERAYLGRRNFNASRFDGQGPKAYKNERGCIAPSRYDAIHKVRNIAGGSVYLFYI